jgi:hypothetical protein
MQKMQPSIDAARKQAEELQKQFGDPAQVAAMRAQAEATRKNLQQQQLAMQKMQPTLDAARKQAEELQKQFGDPTQVAAMRQQAEAARKNLQQQQQQAQKRNKQSADELEKELGL